MPVRELDLGQLSLAHVAGDLWLSVNASGAFNLPSNLSFLNDHELQEALVSGSIWTTRGVACQINIKISFNGKPLDESNRLRVLESLGYQCRDAHLWSQLSLSSSLDIPHCNSETSSGFSIILKFAISPTSLKPAFRGWPLDSVDVKPPAAVSVATFQLLTVNLEFNTQSEYHQSSSKRRKRSVQLHDTVTSSYKASPRQPYPHPFARKTVPHQLLNEILPSNPNKQPIRAENGRFSPWLVTILEKWFLEHANYPWPTNEEKLFLMKQTGLKRGQVNRWMGTKRKTLRSSVNSTRPEDNDIMLLTQDANNKLIDENDDDLLLLSPVNQTFETKILSLNTKHLELSQDMMLLRSNYDLADDESALLQSGVTETSLTFGPLTAAQQQADPVDRKHQLPIISPENYKTVSALDPTVAGLLTSAAFMMLINDQSRTRDVKIETPHRTTTLASVIPTMFCPGFRELMSHNARFLPTICNAASSSWTRNAQGLGLKSKLEALSKVETLAELSEPRRSAKEEVINSVFQSRIWSMMQQGLNESSAVKCLLWERPKSEEMVVNEQSEQSEHPNILDELLVKSNGALDFDSLLDTKFMDENEDEEEIFEMLLHEKETGSHDGLLDYFEEIEREAIEKETEEMLFGSQDTYEEIGDDEFVLDHLSENSDSMLV